MVNGENEIVKVELELGEPPQSVLDYARETYGETPENREQYLDEFRDYIFDNTDKCCPHRTDDDFLIRFLRARKFNIPKAYRLLCNYYSFKENNPHLHRDIRPLDLTFIGEDNILSVPPYRDQNGRRLMIYRVAGWNPSRYSIEEIIKATVIVLELGILEPRAQILGGVCILDLKGLTMAHTWQVTPSLTLKMIEYITGSCPMKIYAIHILHQSWVFDIAYNMVKPFLNQKMRERLYFHGDDMESLHAHIDPKYLPVCYGGSQDEYSFNLWIDWLRSQETIVDEMRRLGYIIDDSDIFKSENNKNVSSKNSSDKNADDSSSDSEYFSDCEDVYL